MKNNVTANDIAKGLLRISKHTEWGFYFRRLLDHPRATYNPGAIILAAKNDIDSAERTENIPPDWIYAIANASPDVRLDELAEIALTDLIADICGDPEETSND